MSRPFLFLGVFVATTLAISLIGALGYNDLKNDLRGMRTDNGALSNGPMEAAISRLEDKVSALGHGQSVPRDTEHGMRDIESVLAAPKQWPQDAKGAEDLRLRLEKLVHEVPPLALQRMRPQFTRLNWGVEALWNLRTHANSPPEDLEEVQAVVEELLERCPKGDFSDLEGALRDHLEKTTREFRGFQRKLLLARASSALDGKDNPAAVFSSLEEFAGDKEADALRLKLRAKALSDTYGARVDSLERDLKKGAGLSDDRLRQIALVSTQDTLLRLIVDWELEDAAPKEGINRAKTALRHCEERLNELAAKHQEANAKKLRRYQAWALDQIRKFDGPNGWYYDVTLLWVRSELKEFKNATDDQNWPAFEAFDSIKELVEELSEVDLSSMKGAMLTAEKRREIFAAVSQLTKWKNDIDQAIAYRATRDGMIKFLLPIQPHLLDPPVAQLYQQAFSKGWQKLEGREDQVFVARQSAEVRKRTLEEVTPNP